MCVSSEHLAFALSAMRETQTMYPTAYMTIARTAYMAAVNAVWVLGPASRTERRRRALKLRADELRTELTTARSLSMPGSPAAEARSSYIDQIGVRQRSLATVAFALGIDEDVEKMRFNQTNAIDWVAKHLHGFEDEVSLGAMQAVWRSSSAAAHAQYSFGIARARQGEEPENGGGQAIVNIYGNLERDVGPALIAASLTLNEAFRLYDIRRIRHISLARPTLTEFHRITGLAQQARNPGCRVEPMSS